MNQPGDNIINNEIAAPCIDCFELEQKYLAFTLDQFEYKQKASAHQLLTLNDKDKYLIQEFLKEQQKLLQVLQKEEKLWESIFSQTLKIKLVANPNKNVSTNASASIK